MYAKIIHRIVILFGLLFAIITLIWNLLADRGLLHSAFMAFCVLLAASTILLFAFQAIARVLLAYLNQKRQEQQREIERQKQLEQEQEKESQPKRQLTGI
jgi:uncharacterized BrkB/YihY/UPF0761 family membrane protein